MSFLALGSVPSPRPGWHRVSPRGGVFAGPVPVVRFGAPRRAMRPYLPAAATGRWCAAIGVAQGRAGVTATGAAGGVVFLAVSQGG